MTTLRSYGFIVCFSLIFVLEYFNSKCLGYHLIEPYNNVTISRIKRQSSCSVGQFRCDNGQCISIHNFCDGLAECADGSDEVVNCNTKGCDAYTFRCAHSACVDGDARCNGVKECVDNSDEIDCGVSAENKCGNQFGCKDGQCINRYNLCDGTKECADGSDETSEQCRSIICQEYSFQCSYGACVDADVKCNGVIDCADGSDETPRICPNIAPVVTPSTPTISGDGCAPPDIRNGNYSVLGQGYNFGTRIPNFSIVSFKCNNNYGLFPSNMIVTCLDGQWDKEVPECRPSCPARVSPSVKISCELNGIEQDCTKPLLEGTIASMKCNQHYTPLASGPFSTAVCQGGSWDEPIIKCVPECGQRTPEGGLYIVNSVSAKQGEFPWHVGVYRKTSEDKYPLYNCGGSIISVKVVLSAAHCFADEANGKKFPASEFFIGAGKYYSDYNSPLDKLAQLRNVTKIEIPVDYRGTLSNFAGDVAVVIVDQPFLISHIVQPVCVDWDTAFEDEQLRHSQNGDIVGWGYTKPDNSEPSFELKYLSSPYIDRGQCLDFVPATFIKFVTSDKFCSGYTIGKSVCNGDSGGGLVFPRVENKRTKYYIRGLVSAGPLKEGSCDNNQYGVYTKISNYMPFIIRMEAFNRVRS